MSRFQLFLSTATIFGIAPTANTAFIVAPKVKSGTITHPRADSREVKANCNATVPFDTNTQLSPPR